MHPERATPSKRLRDALQLGDDRALLDALLEGADPNEQFTNDSYSGTPLGVAINLQRVSGVEILLAHGADPNTRCSHHHWPLQRAAMLGNPALCEVLLRAGADVAPRGRSGKTPLMEIGSARLRRPSDEDCARTARVLLEGGCDALIQGPDGSQALHEAMISRRIGVIREVLLHLVDAGGPLEMAGRHKSAAQIACGAVEGDVRLRLRCMLLACGEPAKSLEPGQGMGPSLMDWTPLEAAAVADWRERVDQILEQQAQQDAGSASISSIQAAASRAMAHDQHHMAAYLHSRCALIAMASAVSKGASARLG